MKIINTLQWIWRQLAIFLFLFIVYYCLITSILSSFYLVCIASNNTNIKPLPEINFPTPLSPRQSLLFASQPQPGYKASLRQTGWNGKGEQTSVTFFVNRPIIYTVGLVKASVRWISIVWTAFQLSWIDLERVNAIM